MSKSLPELLMRAEQIRNSRIEMEEMRKKIEKRNRIGMDALMRTLEARLQKELDEQKIRFDQQLTEAKQHINALTEENKQLEEANKELQLRQQYRVVPFTPDSEASGSSDRSATNPPTASTVRSQAHLIDLERMELWQIIEHYEEKIDFTAIPKTPSPSREYFEPQSNGDAKFGTCGVLSGEEVMQ